MVTTKWADLMPHSESAPSQPYSHLMLILLFAIGGAVYQYGQRQHEVGTLCAGLSPPFPFLNSEQRAAHEAARAVCKGWAPRPKRVAAQPT